MRIKNTLSALVLFVLCCGCLQRATAQIPNFITDKTPCPEGPGVSLDTIFYKPTTQMPFDMCFTLKVTVKGAPQVRYFAVNPVDRNGRLDRNHRDYHTLLKMLKPDRTTRKAFKKLYTYSIFTNSEITRLYSTLKIFNNGKTSDIILHVPPLSPNREYEILLVSDDGSAQSALYDVGAIVFNTGALPPQPAEINQMAQKLNQIASSADNKGNTSHASVSPQAVIDRLTQDTLVFSQNISPKSQTILDAIKQSTKPVVKNGDTTFIPDPGLVYKTRYRVFLKAAGSTTPVTMQLAEKLAANQYIDTIPVSDPERLVLQHSVLVVDPVKKTKVTTPLADIDGNNVKFYADQAYEVYLYSYEELVEHGSGKLRAYQGVSLDKLLDLTESSAGKKATATVNPALPDKGNVKFLPGIITLYQMVKDSVQALTAKPVKDTLAKDALETVMAEAIKCPCSNKGIRDLTQANDLLHIISILSVANVSQLEAMRLGTLSSKDITTKATKTDDYDTRSANIKATITQLQLLTDFLRLNSALSPRTPAFKQLYTSINVYINDLQAESERLRKLISLNATVGNSLLKLFSSEQSQSITGSTQTLDFMTTNKLKIVPDFGFVGVFTGDKVFHVSDLAPYLGFEVDFRSINKNIPMRMVHYKDIWYYLSFSGGVTLTSLAIPNKRVDMFGKQNILTGLGFRINNSLRFTAGGVWFKTVNKDPLKTNQPLGFSPYLGLALDLDLQSLFGGINQLFK
jgi:hypothetical protein